MYTYTLLQLSAYVLAFVQALNTAAGDCAYVYGNASC